MPDVAAVDLIFLPQLVATGGVEALDDYVANNADVNIDDFYPRLVQYDVIDGKRYALPVSTNNMQLIWNKDLFAKAGLDPADAAEDLGRDAGDGGEVPGPGQRRRGL